MKFLKKKVTAGAVSTMPSLEEEEMLYRPDHHGYWTAAICLVLAAAMILASLPTAKTDSVSVNSKVLSGKMSKNPITTVLSGAGTVTASDSEMVRIPASVELKAYHVHNGDVVKAGDPLATVDKVQARAAIVELQSAINSLDSVLKFEKDILPDQVIKSATNGRVKQIFVEPGSDVAQTIVEKGALMVISLDGCMAVDTEQDLHIGETYQVKLSDGSSLKGTVNAVKDGISTITVSDATAPVGDSVVVTDDNGSTICQGELYIHSPVKIMGHYGKVAYPGVKINQLVSVGTNLLSLKEMGHTTKYDALMEKRADFEERMAILARITTDGVLRAEGPGIISGLDADVDFEAYVQEQVRSQATPGSGFRAVFDTLRRGDEDKDEEGTEKEEGTEAIFLLATDSAYYFYQNGTIIREDKDKVFCDANGGDISGVQSGATVVIYGNRIVVTGESGVDVFGLLNSLLQQATGGVNITMETILNMVNGDMEAAMQQVMDIIQGIIEDYIQEMLGAMMAGFSFGGFGSASQPLYETYDMSERDVAEILSTEEVTVSIQVDELDILSLEEGMEAQVSLDAIRGQTFTGVIDHINYYGTNGGGNTKYTVDVTVPRSEKMLESMNASVKVVTDVSEPVDTVPAEALVEQGGKTYIYTAYDAKSDTLGGLTEVETGIADGNQVQILSGLDGNTTFFYRYADSIDYTVGKLRK